MLFKIILSILLILNLAGCATVQKKSTLSQQIEQCQMRIAKLENELQQKDEKICRLEKKLVDVKDLKPPKETRPEESMGVTTKRTAENIQKALKNAGLYQGQVDGKIGTNTKRAIIEFQKLNGLTPDGIAGRKTWGKLKEFLY